MTLINSNEVGGRRDEKHEHDIKTELPEDNNNNNVMNEEAVKGDEVKKSSSEVKVEDGGDRSARNCRD